MSAGASKACILVEQWALCLDLTGSFLPIIKELGNWMAYDARR